VVATDLSATYPPDADALPEIGYQRALDVEPIATFEPTVLLATEIAGPAETLDQLRQLGYPLIVIPGPATPVGPATKIRAVGASLGVPEAGEALAARVQAEIDAATQPTPTDGAPRALALYLRGTSVQLVLGQSSGISWLLEAAGVVDVADELGVADTVPISAEAVVEAAPDVLVVTATGLESVGGLEGLLAIDGLANTPAGRARRVLAYDDQLLLGNGPRTGALLDQLVTDLHQPGGAR
jgi:iron complex transport system substrate-binding protein